MSLSIRYAIVAAAIALAPVGLARADKPKAAPFAVKVVGKGKPMILIPGLACSGEVWDGTVEHFKERYECHVLTLAGFAGQTPVGGPFLETMRKAIADYIREKKLHKPVIVGHSLGAYLVYRLGETESELVGPLVAVDGMLCLMAAFGDKEPPPGMLATVGTQVQTSMSKMPRDEYLKSQQKMIASWLEGSKQLATVTKWGADSDQAVVARAMGELLAADARPDSNRIQSPVLHLAAFNKGLERMGATREVLTRRLEAQLQKIPKHELAVADDSRHFLMYDAPDWMWKKMDAFLAEK